MSFYRYGTVLKLTGTGQELTPLFTPDLVIGHAEPLASSAGMERMLESSPYLDVQAKINESVNRQLQNLVKNVHAHFAQDVVPPSAAASGERLAGMVRVRGGGCAASKPHAQAEPIIQDLDGPPRSPSLAVEQGAEATPEDAKVVEPVPDTTDSAPTEVVEPAAGEATEAETATEVTRAEPPPAEASAETRNPIFEIGSSWIDAIVQAFTPRGTSVPNTAPISIELAPLWTTEDLKEVSTRLADQLLINTENQVQIEEIFNHLHQTKDGILTKEEFGPRTPREVSLRDGSGSLPFWAPPLAAHHTSPAARGPVQPPPSSPQLACALPRGAASASDKAPLSFAWCAAGVA